MINRGLPQRQGDTATGPVPGMPLPGIEVPASRIPRAGRSERKASRLHIRSKAALPLGVPFRSFWMGGYESRPALDASAMPDALVGDSYSRLLEFGIRTVRENADWALVDRGGVHDLRPLEHRARMAKDLGVQVAWTLFTHRWPEGVDFLSAAFVDGFARYARAVAGRVAEFDPGQVPVFTPINEPSFLAWSVFSSGRVSRRDGSRASLEEIKRQLARAAIAACDAILEKVPHARLLHTDPLEHVVAPPGQPSMEAAAKRRAEGQFEAWDWIGGRAAGDLGGSVRYLDLVGVNYYAENQWELGSNKRLGWQIDDPRRLPLSAMLKAVHLRYQRPVVIAETSHSGVRRGAWVREIAAEVRAARRLGVRIDGVCLHPMIDQLDGANPGKWLLRGLWEVRNDRGTERLELNSPYASALRAAQKVVGALAEDSLPQHAPVHV
jgi:UDP-galactopyranose mutase